MPKTKPKTDPKTAVAPKTVAKKPAASPAAAKTPAAGASSPTSAAKSAAAPPPRASIEAKKVYLKDASFESPASPTIFAQSDIDPQLDVQMTMTHQPIDGNFYEVVLSVNATATHAKAPIFLAEVQQAGIFEITHIPPDNLDVVLETACPHVLLPFAREALASLISKGGFPQLLLSPINFQALYHQKKAKQARAAAHPPR